MDEQEFMKQCGNHPEGHVALSEEEMEALSLEYGCSDWFDVAGTRSTNSAVWCCSNHTPRHAARTKTEMQSCTKLYQCTGWKVC